MRYNQEKEWFSMELKGRCIQVEQRDRATNAITFILLDYATKEEIRAFGVTKMVEINTQYCLEGDYHHDGTFRFGNLRKMTNCRQESIDLLSICLTGISEQIAMRIVDTLGDDIFSCAKEHNLYSRLVNIPGVGNRKADAVIEFIKQGTDENELFRFLSGYSVPYTSILRLLSEAPKTSIDTIAQNPFMLMAYDAPFKLCDEIGVKAQLDPWATNRIYAMIRQVLQQMHQRGDIRMEYDAFLKTVTRYSFTNGKSTLAVPTELVDILLHSMEYGKIYQDGEKRYISSVSAFLQERTIVQNTSRIKMSKKTLVADVKKYIEEIEESELIQYNDEQREVFKVLESGGISILLGGPGTGKTTVINGIVKAYLSEHPDGHVLLCAPTGRAAARITEISKHTAKTIHKAMQLRWYNNDMKVEPLQYDFIIADELSMCDTELFSLFTKAIQSGTTVLLSGDYNQIPSVGPGQILRDLAESEQFPVYRLEAIIRQKADSLIIRNANAILNGEKLKTGPDFQVAIAANDNAIFNTIRKMKYERIPQILCPIKKSIAGTFSINHQMQTKREWTDSGVWIDGMMFHAGDKVIMNTNNYEVGYMNGDTGVIRAINNGFMQIDFVDKSLNIATAKTDGMNLSYALTFHKSQGAESDEILIVLPSQATRMATRELLYTAVTRARKKVFIMATEGVLESYMLESKKARRECGLKSGLLGRIKY